MSADETQKTNHRFANVAIVHGWFLAYAGRFLRLFSFFKKFIAEHLDRLKIDRMLLVGM